MNLKKLFYLEDQLLKTPGLYGLWTVIFVTNFIVLLSDGTTGVSRDFNVITNVLSTVYCAIALWNNIYGNKKPSSMLMLGGSIHQYAFWCLFAYYGTGVLGSHPVGVMNWICLIIVSLFTADMIFKTWYVSVHPDEYLKYISEVEPASES